MNEMKKRIIQRGLAVLSGMVMIFSMFGMTAQAQEAVTVSKTEASESVIMPRADNITTYYRTYNGKLQKRRWNVTRGYWVDADWITIS